jgi:bacterioferritin-associated ferredoxin
VLLPWRRRHGRNTSLLVETKSQTDRTILVENPARRHFQGKEVFQRAKYLDRSDKHDKVNLVETKSQVVATFGPERRQHPTRKWSARRKPACTGNRNERVVEQINYHRTCDGCPERLVCHCLRITESVLLETLTTWEVRTVTELCHLTGAGDGCTACRHRLCEYVERYAYSSPLPICSVK